MPLNKDRPLRTTRLALVSVTLLASGCTAVGWELQNYAFYGATPAPDGRRLTPSNVLEQMIQIDGTDSTVVREGEFQVDTVRQGGERIWVATRRMTDSLKRPVLDSVWLDRYELRTLSSFHQDGEGRQYRQSFNRRVVKTEIREPNGKVRRRQVMHQAAPYSRIGIELVVGALKWQRTAKGALPVVSLDGQTMTWLDFEVIGQTTEPRRVPGGVSFEPIWVVRVKLDGEEARWWVDDVAHRVLRRSSPRPDGSQMLVALGRPIPRLALFDVAPLSAVRAPALAPGLSTGAPTGRVLGGGRTLAPGAAVSGDGSVPH